MTISTTGDLFGRAVTLSILNTSSVFGGIGPSLPNLLLTPSGMRVTFKITKGNKSKKNKATISIYNLSAFNRNKVIAPISRGGDPNLQVVLTAGYGVLQGVLFTGRGTATTKWVPPNYVTTLLVEDGAPSMNSSAINKSYPVGTPVDLIITDIGVALLPTGVVLGPYAPIGIALKRGRSFSGSADRVLDDLGSAFGFEFDIQDGIGIISKAGIPITPLPPVILSQYSGLIGKPYTDGKIVRAKSLINALIKPGSIVSLAVVDTSLLGLYRVKRVVAKGDNYGKDWTMDIEMASLASKEAYITLTEVQKTIFTGGAL